MPRTAHRVSRPAAAGRARWLAAVLLVTALTACSGGGGDQAPGASVAPAVGAGDQPSQGPATEEPRTPADGNSGAFKNAGAQVQAQGVGKVVKVQVNSLPPQSPQASAPPSGEALVRDVHLCSGAGGNATPASRTVTLTNGTSPLVEFILPAAPPPGDSGAICLTLIKDGVSENGQAAGTVSVSPTSSSPSGGPGETSSSGPGTESSSGPSNEYPSGETS